MSGTKVEVTSASTATQLQERTICAAQCRTTRRDTSTAEGSSETWERFSTLHNLFRKKTTEKKKKKETLPSMLLCCIYCPANFPTAGWRSVCLWFLRALQSLSVINWKAPTTLSPNCLVILIRFIVHLFNIIAASLAHLIKSIFMLYLPSAKAWMLLKLEQRTRNIRPFIHLQIKSLGLRWRVCSRGLNN